MAYLLGAYPFLGADQTAQNAGKEHLWDKLDVVRVFQIPVSLTQNSCYKPTLFNFKHKSSSSRAVQLEGQSVVRTQRLNSVSHM